MSLHAHESLLRAFIVAAHRDPTEAARYRPFAFDDVDRRPGAGRPAACALPDARGFIAAVLRAISATTGHWARRLQPPVAAPCCEPGCCELAMPRP